MKETEIFANIFIYGVMAASLLAAVGAVTLRGLFHAALCLAIVLIGAAGLFISLHADFLAMVQILIYVGAVMTLVIFAIMLTERFGDRSIKQSNRQVPIAFLGSALFAALLIGLIQTTPWPVKSEAAAHVTTSDLGKALLGQYVFPFEVISVILLAALIGAIVIARKDPS